MVFTQTKSAEWCTLTQRILPLVLWKVNQTRYFGTTYSSGPVASIFRSPSFANRSYSRVSCARAVSGTVSGNSYRLAYSSDCV